MAPTKKHMVYSGIFGIRTLCYEAIDALNALQIKNKKTKKYFKYPKEPRNIKDYNKERFFAIGGYGFSTVRTFAVTGKLHRNLSAMIRLVEKQ